MHPNLHMQVGVSTLDKSSVTGKMQTLEFWTRRTTIYAIVKTGGKQVRASEGQSIDVDRLPEEEGASVDLDQVLLLSDDEKVVTGRPVVEGAKVKATVVEHGRSPKVTVFKYKSKIRYRRKKGHRQPYTRLRVDEIVTS